MSLKCILSGGLCVALMASAAMAQQKSLTRDLTPEQREVEDVRPPQSDLRVSAWVDRNDDSYKPGDTLSLFVKTNMDAHVWVVDVGTSGKVHILFPNKFQKDNKVLAHQVVQIPGSDATWRIKVGGPAGQELIKVIATTKPDAVIDPIKLADLGSIYQYRESAQALTRDLSAVLKNNDGGISATFEKVIRILPQNSALPTSSPQRSAALDAPPQKAGSALKTEDLFRLGETAYFGDGGTPNYRRALQFFTEAASAGHVGAMFLAGRIHEQGLDVDQSVDRAKDLFRRAADLGSTQAMVHLAILHVKPGSTDRQPAEAVRLLRKAATQGDGMAMIHLAKLHDEGHGVDRNPRESARYLLSALRTGAWTVFDQAPKMSEEARRELQAQLRDAGHYKGTVDGRIGAETRAALAEWAKAG
jgi:hypothetical protein